MYCMFQVSVEKDLLFLMLEEHKWGCLVRLVRAVINNAMDDHGGKPRDNWF